MFISSFVELFFPKVCIGCEKKLLEYDDAMCLNCLADLPYAHISDTHNPVAKLFHGILPIQNSYSLFQFHEGGIIQHALHALKYKRDQEAGNFTGRLLGKALKKETWINEIDLIIPVPIHPSRRRQRGYNQVDVIIDGMVKYLEKPIDKTNFYRKVSTTSQTKKSRFARWKNVNAIFAVKNGTLFEGKHILLVDDVITTGNTLIACAEVLLKINGVNVSIATLAYA